MPDAAAGTILWHLTFLYELHNQQCQNGFYFTNRIPIPNDSDSIAGHAAGLITFWNIFVLPPIKHFQNTQVHYSGLICSTQIPKHGPIVEHVYAGGTGDQEDESLPSYCSAILSLRTGFGGKSNRGRLYIGGIPENDTSESILDVDSFAALRDIGDQLLAGFGPSGSSSYYRYVVYSKKLGNPTDNTPTTAGIRPITHILARRTLGTQRHRLLGVGT